MQVDVWSVGVILFQMLYGKRPFGEGLSQERIARDQVMLNAHTVTFPAKPAVSPEAKAFISQCAPQTHPCPVPPVTAFPAVSDLATLAASTCLRREGGVTIHSCGLNVFRNGSVAIACRPGLSV